MARQIEVNLLVKSQTEAAEKNIQRLSETLQKIATTNVTVQSGSLDKAVQSAQQLQIHLQNAINTKTNKIDLSQLNASLRSAGTSLTTLTSNLRGAGAEGQQAFMQVARAISQAEVPMVRMNGALARFGTTLLNTVKWQIASKLIHGIQGSLQGAFQHAKNLNSALNSIQIVTGSSAGHMADFAEKARQAATALNATTTEYAKASLIFFQQGLDEKAAMERTNTVIKLAQVTGQSVDEIASQMTAIWNNFDDGTESLEHYADVITALGAKTASSSAEIAQGMQKFAAVAETVGLSYEKAAAALATIVAITRQSEDVVGTALKTILARVDSLKLGETLDDDVTLNKYAKALQTIGVNVLDSNQNLKNMDIILDELGEKWKLISEAQKVAVAETVAGQRQYAQFMALMNNYDAVLQNQGIAENSKGTLQKQAEIWSTSWEAAAKRVEQSQKNLYDSMINSDFMIKMEDIFSGLISGISAFTRSVGGIGPLLMMITGLASKTLFPMLQHGFQKLSDIIAVWSGKTQRDMAITQGALAAETQKNTAANMQLTEAQKIEQQITVDLLSKKAALTVAMQNMTTQQKTEAKLSMDIYEAKMNEIKASVQAQIEAEKEAEALKNLSEQEKYYLALAATRQEKSYGGNRSFYKKNLVEKAQSQQVYQTRANINSLSSTVANSVDANKHPEVAAAQTVYSLSIKRDVLAEKQNALTRDGQQNSTEYSQLSNRLKEVEDNIQKNVEGFDTLKTKYQEGRKSLADYIHTLDGYKSGTLSTIQALEKEERILELQLDARKKMKSSKATELSYGNIAINSYLMPDKNDPSLDPTSNTKQILQGQLSGTDNDIAVNEANFRKLSESINEANFAAEDFRKIQEETKTSLQQLSPFSLKDIDNKKRVADEAKKAAEDEANNVNSIRARVKALQSSLLVDKHNKNARNALKDASKELTSAEQEYVKLQNQAAAAQNALNSSTSDSQKSLLSLRDQVKSMSKEVTFSEENLQAFDTAIENLAQNGYTEKGLEALNQALKNLEQEADKSGSELDDLRQAMYNAIPPEVQERFRKIEEATFKVGQAAHETKNKMRGFGQSLGEVGTRVLKMSDVFTTLASVASRLYMGLNALRSVANVWSDKDASTFDKVMTTMMSMSMLIPVLIAGYKGLVAMEKNEIVVKAASTKAWWANAVAAAASWAASHPVAAGMIIATIAAVTLGVLAMANAHKKAAEEAKAQAQKDVELAKTLSEATNKIIEQTTALGKLTNEYERLKNSGQSVVEVQKNIIDQVPELINGFNDLSQKINLSGQKLEKFRELITKLELAAAADNVSEVVALNSEIANFLADNEQPAIDQRVKLATANFIKFGRDNKISNQFDDTSAVGLISWYETILKEIENLEQKYSPEDLAKNPEGYETLKKEIQTFAEVYNELQEAVNSNATLQAWKIVNDNAEDIQEIDSYTDYNNFRQGLNSTIDRISEKLKIDKEVLIDSVDALLKQMGFDGYQLVDNGLQILEKNIGKEASENLRNYYESASQETKTAFENAVKSFTNVLSEDQAKALIDLQESLDIKEATEKAIKGLTAVEDKLKETGMTAEDWSDIKSSLYESGIDIDTTAFKQLTYFEQQNVLQTLKRNNILSNIESSLESIKKATQYQVDYTTKIQSANDLGFGADTDSGIYLDWLRNNEKFGEIYKDIEAGNDNLVKKYLEEIWGRENIEALKNGTIDPNHQTEHPGTEDIVLPDEWSYLFDRDRYNEFFLKTQGDKVAAAAYAAFWKNVEEDWAQNGVSSIQEQVKDVNTTTQREFYRIAADIATYQQSITDAISNWGSVIRSSSSLQELNMNTQSGNKILETVNKWSWGDLGEAQQVIKGIEDFSKTGDYSQALITLANNYENTADEVTKYTLALQSNNEAAIEAAENSLKLSIRVGELSKQFSLEASDTEMQARLIKQAYPDFSEETAAQLATNNQRLNRGVKTLVDNFKTWNSVLSTADVLSTEYASTLNDMYESLADITGAIDVAHIPVDFLSRSFKNGATAIDLMSRAAQGDLQAIKELKKELAVATISDLNFNTDTKEYKNEDGTLLTNLSIDLDAFNTTKEQIITGIETIYEAAQNLAPSTTLEDNILGPGGREQFISNLNAIALATGKTVEEMNAFLSQIGVEIPVETYPYKTTRKIPKIITHREVTRTNTGPGTYSEDIFEWSEDTGQVTEVPETIPIALIGENADIKIKDIKIKATGSPGGISKGATKPSSTTKRESTKNASNETERYHVINKETEQLTKAYDRLNTAKDRAFGADRLKLMDAEIANTKKQIALNKEYIAEVQAYAQQDYNNLINGKQNAYTIDGQWYSSEGLRGLGVELQLDENGVIQNYNEIMAAATAKYNERIAAYNANPENSNLKEIADAEFNAIKELISQYEETNGLVQDKLDENKKLLNQLQDLNFERYNYKIELRVKIADLDKKRLEYELREIGDDAFKSAEALSKMFSTTGDSSQWKDALDRLQIQKDNFKEIQELFAQDQISEQDYIEGLGNIQDNIYEQLTAILDLKDAMEDYYKNTLSKLKEKYDELCTAMSKNNEIFDHTKNILELIGESTNYGAIGEILEGQTAISQDIYETSQQEYLKNKRLEEQRRKELAEAEAAGGAERIAIAKKNLQAAEEARRDSYSTMLSDLADFLTKQKTVIDNNITKAYAASENTFTNGLGFDYLNQVMELAAAGQERYYTKTNQIYETEKMRRKLQQDMDKTTNTAAKQRLALFDRELQALRDKNELSKVELSLAQGRYELLLAQIALEEAQNAKTAVRLQRDAEGNYGYVYTADQNAIAEAEQNVADKENDLYNTAREAEAQSLQDALKLRQEWLEKDQEIDKNETLSFEQKQQQKAELEKYYLAQLMGLEGDHVIALAVLNETSATQMNDTWTTGFQNIIANQKKMIVDFQTQQGELNTYLYGEDGESGAFGDLKKAVSEVLGPALSNLGTIINQNTEESKKFREELIGKDGKGGVVKAAEDEANAVAKTTIEFGKAYDKAEQYIQSLKDINAQIDELIKKAAEKIIQEYEDHYEVSYHTTYTETGSRPPEISSSTETGGTKTSSLSLADLFGDQFTETEKPFYKVTFKLNSSHAPSSKPDVQLFTSTKDIDKYIQEHYNATLYKTSDKIWNYGSDSLGSVIIESINNAPEAPDIRIMSKKVFKVKYLDRIGQANSSSILPMDTGGYTGQWYHSSDDPIMSGKLAMLHEKELVLNQEDTKNFLASIEMVRDLARIIDLQAASVGLRQQLEARFGFDAAQSELAQNIVIHADFPNATDHNEIMEALETLADRAAQYANRTNR